MKFGMKIFAAGVAALVLFGSVADVAVAGRKEEKLCKAAYSDDYAAAEKWIEKGANANGHCEGSTPLYKAARRGSGIIALLIRKGADVNATIVKHDKVFSGDVGNTALHGAALAGKYKSASLLIANGANVNAKGGSGDTPLHDAAVGDRDDVAKLLISKGADVNAKNKYGNTPLHTSADSIFPNDGGVTKLLLSNGANAAAKNIFGKTPLDNAHAKDNIVEANIIKAHIATQAKAAANKKAAAQQAAAAKAAAAQKVVADKKSAADKKIAAELESANIAYKVGNYEAAFPLYQSLAEGGNEYAQGKLAVMYEKGQGTAIDTAEAKRWYQRIIENEAGKPAVVAWAKERFYSLP